MDVSIVVPCLNHASFLKDSLDSLIAQENDGVELEILVVDGGSTDGTQNILSRYAARLSYCVSEPDRGQSHAVNKGFHRSRGEIMGWLNSDDALVPGALAKVVDCLTSRPAVDVVYGNAQLVDRQGAFIRTKKEIPFDLEILLWDYCYLPQTSTFWRRDIWDRTLGLDESLHCAMDYDLWLKFARAGAQFLHLPHVLSRQRVYPEQKNQRFRAVSNREDQLLRQRYLARPVPLPERLARKCLHKARRIGKRLAIGAYWA